MQYSFYCESNEGDKLLRNMELRVGRLMVKHIWILLTLRNWEVTTGAVTGPIQRCSQTMHLVTSTMCKFPNYICSCSLSDFKVTEAQEGGQLTGFKAFEWSDHALTYIMRYYHTPSRW